MIASTHTWQSKADAPAPPWQSQARAAPPLLVSCSLERAAPSRAGRRSACPAVAPIPPAVAATINVALSATVQSTGRATQTWYPPPRPDGGERPHPAASGFVRLLIADGAVRRRLRQQGETADAPHGGAGVPNFPIRPRGRSPPRRMSAPSGPGRPHVPQSRPPAAMGVAAPCGVAASMPLTERATPAHFEQA